MAHFSRSYIQALEAKINKANRDIAGDKARANGSNKTAKVEAFSFSRSRHTAKFDLNDLSK